MFSNWKKAIKAGDPAEIKRLISIGADVNWTYASGDMPLMIAAKKGDVKIVRELLANGADINAKNKYGYTALMLSVRHSAVVKLLIEAGADIDAKNKAGKTVFHLAKEGGFTGTSKILTAANLRVLQRKIFPQKKKGTTMKEPNKTGGFVYILGSDEIPGVFKLRHTENPPIGAGTEEVSVTLKFKVQGAMSVEDLQEAKKLLQRKYDKTYQAVGEGLFLGSPQDAKSDMFGVLEYIDGSAIYAGDNAKTAKPRRTSKKPGGKRPQFTFSELGIKVGEELQFIDDRSIVAVVQDATRSIVLKDKPRTKTTTSEAVKTALKKINPRAKLNKAYKGTDFWLYKNKTLEDIRRKKGG